MSDIGLEGLNCSLATIFSIANITDVMSHIYANSCFLAGVLNLLWICSILIDKDFNILAKKKEGQNFH